MKQAFEDTRFTAASEHTIDAANVILREYAAKGLNMTLRQIHYQFVSRAIIMHDGEAYTNTEKSYKRLGDVLSKGRLAGRIDWAHMEDRTRELTASTRWSSPSSIVNAVAHQYQEDLWRYQKVRPEVWVEKEALAGVIEDICTELRIDYFSCRGYVSQSAQYNAAMRFRGYIKNGQTPIILHFGDHDPSGLDMTRENRAKFRLLTGHNIEVRRLALNHEQVLEYNPPPNPTKLTDSRAPEYVAQFGEESWELDALDPEVLQQLVRTDVEALIDRRAWARAEREEAENKGLLEAVANRWDEVREHFGD